MKIISSPAKLMTVEKPKEDWKSTTPIFIQEASNLQNELKEKTPKFLAELMEISNKLADENWERNQKWNPKPKKNECSQALFAFTGEVYRGLDANTLDDKSLDYLQAHFRILSGLYGLLKPSDKIMLYRLEMGRNFGFNGQENLYSFWGETLTNQINKELRKKESLLNLASKEYAKVLFRKKIENPIIDVDFYEIKSGTPKNIAVFTKHARGLMARFCAQKQITNPEELKTFDLGGYCFDEKLSKENHLIFVR